jgi:hypothetical protein
MTTMKGAFAGGPPNFPLPLNNFNETPVLQLYWIGGNVVVQGRLRILNDDRDTQLFKIWLTHGYPRQTMDYVEWGMPGTNALNENWQMVYLSGWAFDLPANEIIEIVCATYSGYVDIPRMTATLLDDPR